MPTPTPKPSPAAVDIARALVQLATDPAPARRRYPAPQTSRMHRVMCPQCGYLARASRRWLAVGAPLCPTHNVPMVETAR